VDLTGVDLAALARRFTMGVAELDAVEDIGKGLDRVVVGHVLDVQAIEGKKVRLTRVDCGAHGVLSIVCGAPNVAAGQLVPVALAGQKLGDMTISVAPVAGVQSHGMICSEKELGLSDQHAGILVLDVGKPGALLGDVVPVVDTVFVIDNKSLTHRPDCWGHRGIAREVAAIIERPLIPLDCKVIFSDQRPLTIGVEDAQACPRYTATTLGNIKIAPSPLWLRLLLTRVGTRPINNIVDATNFVMLDLGNPLHAFDRRQIRGDAILVRNAVPGERFTTLDGQPRALATGDLVIADGERAVALAGVMGGLDSEVKDDTTEIVLESANFDAARVRATAQRLALRTESSARFEKSLDPLLVGDAVRSFCGLVQLLSPNARVTSAVMEVAAPPPPPTVIRLPIAYVQERLGYAVDEATVVKILSELCFKLAAAGEGEFEVTVPTWRATKDIAIAEDLVEEVGRVFGYDNIPPQAPVVTLDRPDRNAKKKLERLARNHLSLTAGLDELQTYSFDDDAFLERAGIPRAAARVTLRNPISQDEPAMRRSIVPHLVQALDKNARGFANIRLYEIGRVFHPLEPVGNAFVASEQDGLPHQPTTLSLLIAGTTAQDNWFRAARGILTGLSRAIEREEPMLMKGGVAHAWAHPVRQAMLRLGDGQLGHMAELHPLMLAKLGLRHTGAVLELDLDAWRESPPVPAAYAGLPRYPSVYRDFSAVVPAAVQSLTLSDTIRKASTLVTNVHFLSVFVLPDGTKSLAFSATFGAPDRTLTDAEVKTAEDRIWDGIQIAGGVRRA
jgi:phenylalanyl-tRNA synthetase beta chain